MEINYGNYECKYTTVEARVYTEFHPDIFKIQVAEVFNIYIKACRNAVLVTVYLIIVIIMITFSYNNFFLIIKRYCITGFIAFLLLLDILLKAVSELLRKLNALKINRKR